MSESAPNNSPGEGVNKEAQDEAKQLIAALNEFCGEAVVDYSQNRL